MQVSEIRSFLRSIRHKKKLVYRLETSEGTGPYFYSFKKDWREDNHYNRNPLISDEQGCREFCCTDEVLLQQMLSEQEERLEDRSFFRFGCESLSALYSRFSDSELKALADDGLVLAVYEVNEVFCFGRQCVFNGKSAIKVNTLPLETFTESLAS